MKKCSILLSVYKPNKTDLIKQLNSLDNQTYENLEVLIHDDCPEERCDKNLFSECLKKVKYRILPYLNKNLGYTKAFERLVKEVKHDGYISFCDQDDIWLPNKVEESIKELEKNNAVLVATDRMKIDENDNVTCKSVWHTSTQRYLTWETGDDIAKYNVFNCYSPGMCILTTADMARKALPFSIHTGHDLWIIACACMNGVIARLDKPLIMNRRHGNNASGFLIGVNCKKDYFKRIKENQFLIEDLKKKYSNYKDIDEIESLSSARMNKNIFKMFKYRYLNPKFTIFEIGMILMPDFLFKLVLKLIRKKYDY